MKQSGSSEQVNVITWVPEEKQWGAVTSVLYSAQKAKKRKRLALCLMVGISLSLIAE